MDNLVLIRTVAVLHASLTRTVLADIRQEGPFWFRARFEGPDRPRSLLISMQPEMPWIVQPIRLAASPPRVRTPFLDGLRKRLMGIVLAAVEKPTFDRWVRLRFESGACLLIELSPHGANLILVDEDDRVVQALRSPRRRAASCEPGAVWQPPSLPSGLVDPSSADPATLDLAVQQGTSTGDVLFESIRRRVFGIGSEGASLVAAESRGVDVGRCIRRNVQAVEDGQVDPVIRIDDDGSTHLLPWPPRDDADVTTERNAASTAGRYYMEREWDQMEQRRREGLMVILDRELDRLRKAMDRVQSDLDRLGDPGVHRRQAEALAAGLTQLLREGDRWTVPDPQDPASRLVIPHRGGAGPAETIDELYGRGRRAERGRQEVQERLRRLQATRDSLLQIQGHDSLDPDRLEAGLRAAGVPVGLRTDTRAERLSAQIRRPRIEGVRMLTSRAGETILIGRNAKENQHVTFRLAGPEDFWFHALGVTGAHVIVRNEQRRKRPREETLEDAAAAAAYFSDARNQAWVDVQWTRRKWVRKPRGGAPGAVLVKRSETIRVRPGIERQV